MKEHCDAMRDFFCGNGDFGMEVTILITKEGCQNMVKIFWICNPISSLEVCVI